MIISNTELTEHKKEPATKRQSMLAFHDEEGNKYWVVTSDPQKVIAHLGEENLVWTKER